MYLSQRFAIISEIIKYFHWNFTTFASIDYIDNLP